MLGILEEILKLVFCWGQQ